MFTHDKGESIFLCTISTHRYDVTVEFRVLVLFYVLPYSIGSPEPGVTRVANEMSMITTISKKKKEIMTE